MLSLDLRDNCRDSSHGIFNNISKLDSKATGAKVSIDSTIPPFNPKYGNLHRNLLCVRRGPVCVCARAIIMAPHFAR